MDLERLRYLSMGGDVEASKELERVRNRKTSTRLTSSRYCFLGLEYRTQKPNGGGLEHYYSFYGSRSMGDGIYYGDPGGDGWFKGFKGLSDFWWDTNLTVGDGSGNSKGDGVFRLLVKWS